MPQQRRPVNRRDVRVHAHAGDVVLRPLVQRDRDHVAGRVRLVGDVGVGDPEVGVAVLHVIAADRLLVGGEAIGIVDVGALEPGQEVHRARLHQVAQTVAGDGVVADEADVTNAGLPMFVNREDKIDASIGKLNEPLGDLGFVVAVFLVGVLDAADVGLAERLAVGHAGLRLDLDLELVLGDLAVALEGDAIDDLLAGGERHDDAAVFRPGADRGINPRRLQVVHAALDRGRVRPAEIGLETGRRDAGVALDHDLLRESRRRRRQSADRRSRPPEPERRRSCESNPCRP